MQIALRLALLLQLNRLNMQVMLRWNPMNVVLVIPYSTAMTMVNPSINLFVVEMVSAVTRET